MILIDRQPPAPTGDRDKDMQAMLDYMAYLYEQLNFILANVQKGDGND